MMYDLTQTMAEARKYYDELLDENIKQISELSGVPAEKMKKINPVSFIDKMPNVLLRGHEYQDIEDFITAEKSDDCFLISPLDAVQETANQISYKQNVQIEKTVRASKCKVEPLPPPVIADFCRRNHRQSVPNISRQAVCFGLIFESEVVAIMFYDISHGAIRGANENYELVRLAIKHNYRVHGGASKLQKACEDALRGIGVSEIYSYSNATINNGAVYKQLGFSGSEVYGGQPFVIMEDKRLVRLIQLYPYTTNGVLAARGRMKTHVSGNKMWKKNIEE